MSDSISFREVQEIFNDIQEGDRLEISRGAYSHWATISRKEYDVTLKQLEIMAIHLTIGSSQAVNVSSGLCKGKFWFANGEVREDPLTIIAGSSTCRVNNTLDHRFAPKPTAEIIKRAQSKIGQHKYHVLKV